MIIIFVVPAGFVHPSFPFPASPVRPSVRPSLPSRSSFPFSSSLCAPPLPGTGFSSQTRRGVFDKLASPPWNLARFTSGPFLCIRQKAACAVASLAFVFFALDYSPPLRSSSSSPIYDRLPCSISIPYLLLRTIIFFACLCCLCRVNLVCPLSASSPLPLLLL